MKIKIKCKYPEVYTKDFYVEFVKKKDSTLSSQIVMKFGRKTPSFSYGDISPINF